MSEWMGGWVDEGTLLTTSDPKLGGEAIRGVAHHFPGGVVGNGGGFQTQVLLFWVGGWVGGWVDGLGR